VISIVVPIAGMIVFIAICWYFRDKLLRAAYVLADLIGLHPPAGSDRRDAEAPAELSAIQGPPAPTMPPREQSTPLIELSDVSDTFALSTLLANL